MIPDRGFLIEPRTPRPETRLLLVRPFRERLVVLLHEFSELLGDVAVAGEQHFVALQLGAAAQVELEALDRVRRLRLEALELRRVAIDLVVVKRTQLLEDLGDRSLVLLADAAAELLGVGCYLADFSA